MEDRKIVKLVRREIRALLKLSPWVLVSLLFAAVLWHTDLAAFSGLFQSPATPTATSELPTPTETLAPTETPTVAPTEEPTVAPAETTVVTPTETLVPTEAVPPTAENTATATTAPPSATPQPTATLASGATPDESQRYPDEGQQLKFDWGMLFDSVALGLSYVWLCCGILIFVSIPIIFVILWVMSKRRQQQEE
jgi:hypothetical protein